MIAELYLLDSDETLTTDPTNATEHDEQTMPELPHCYTTLLTHHSSHPTTILMITCISLHPFFNPYSINPLSLI